MQQIETFILTDQLMDLITQGVDRAISMLDENDENFIPFILTESATVAWVHNTASVGEVVRIAVNEGKLECCALIYTGHLSVDGERSNAIFVEGFERGIEQRLCFAQCYKPSTHARPLQRVGSLEHLGCDTEFRYDS